MVLLRRDLMSPAAGEASLKVTRRLKRRYEEAHHIHVGHLGAVHA